VESSPGPVVNINSLTTSQKRRNCSLTVRQLDGSAHVISYNALTTIEELKMYIENETSVPSTCQRLIYNGIELIALPNTVTSYQIVPNCTLYLISLFGSVYEEQVHFCIDVSFSMDNKLLIGNKLFSRIDCVKDELSKMIRSFHPEKKINLYAFGSSIITWSKTLKECNLENKLSAIEWLNKLEPFGTTAMFEALEAVVDCDSQAKTVYVLSDGYPNNEEMVLKWIVIHPKVVINTTSFEAAYGASEFLSKMANSTRGIFRSFNSTNLK